MSTIVTRAEKGSPLTHNEVDANFNNLNTDKYQGGDSISAENLTVSGNTMLGDTSTNTLNVGDGDLFKAANGNVGIGTTSPTAKLDVSGSAATSVEGSFTNTSAGISSSAGVRGQANSTGAWLLRQYSTAVTATVFGQTLANYALLASQGASSNGLMLGSLTADPVIFGTNDAERMRIHSSGGVSIGNTTDTSAGSLRVTNNVSATTLSLGDTSVYSYVNRITLTNAESGRYSGKIGIRIDGGQSILALGVRSDNVDYNSVMELTNSRVTIAANATVTGCLSGGYIAHADGTTAMVFGADNVVRVTPNATATYTTTVPAAGAICVLSILTSGTTSYTITFGTGFKTTGTLATGTVTARYFNITFVSDGSSLIETARTVAIA